MNISYRWLQALLPGLEESPAEIADRLAMQGAPVDEIVDIGGALRDVVIARVVEREPHPNADRLSLCRVDAGTGDLLQVVCGAPNVRAGGIYPFAPVGAALPGDLVIRKAKIRGTDSQGMLCSARELGLGREHEGILELHGELPVGASFIDAVGLADARLVVDVTPNRPDLLSHIGVARELGAELGLELHLPEFPGAAAVPEYELVGGNPAEAGGVRVAIEDEALCPRYLGLVIRDVRVGPSPEWLASRLRALGLRPISNVVDATNWVLHELGQPLHAFDLDRLGKQVLVRTARAGEKLVTLDGVERTLAESMLMITDGSRPVAVAGVMGGADTEVQADTTSILLECALFASASIRRTRRALDLSTDASYRFERGVDAEGMERALRRAAELIVATAGGTVAEAAAVAGAGVAAPEPIRLRISRLQQVLGAAIGAPEAAALLEPLGYAVVERSEEALVVRVPGPRRHDVRAEIDLVEEVARRYGYERFAAELGPFRPTAVPDDALLAAEDRLRTQLVARGLLESRTAAFAAEAEGDVALLLPLSAAEGRLRAALVPALLHRLELNFSRGQRHLRLFELGTAFAAASPLPEESRRLAVALTGGRTPPHWSGPAVPIDLWDLKALLEEVATELGLGLEPGDTDVAWLEPGHAFRLVTEDGRLAGWGGRVRTRSVDAPPWADAIFAAEVALEPRLRERQRFTPLPAHPGIERDLALLVPQTLSAAEVLSTIRSAAGPLLETLEPFDLYRGKGVPEGTHSLAVRLRFRAPDRTLTDAEVDNAVARVLKRLEDAHGIERRG